MPIQITGSATIFGSNQIPSELVDREFGMPEGKLRNRAGIHSIARAAKEESEVSLAVSAAKQALAFAQLNPENLDCIIATSETHNSYPSLAANLHASLNARDSCGALDVGGACLGLLNALFVAQSFLYQQKLQRVLVVTADVHSKVLIPGKVPGEFGGLFGDGATSFALQRDAEIRESGTWRLGNFFFGCANQYSDAISVRAAEDGNLDLVFDGEGLSRGAILQLARIVGEIETRSGFKREDALGFATHQPNPRLVALLAKQLEVERRLFPTIAEKRGNLGSSTCGAALVELLQQSRVSTLKNEGAIFLASLGPGLMTGGGWITHSR